MPCFCVTVGTLNCSEMNAVSLVNSLFALKATISTIRHGFVSSSSNDEAFGCGQLLEDNNSSLSSTSTSSYNKVFNGVNYSSANETVVFGCFSIQGRQFFAGGSTANNKSSTFGEGASQCCIAANDSMNSSSTSMTTTLQSVYETPIYDNSLPIILGAAGLVAFVLVVFAMISWLIGRRKKRRNRTNAAGAEGFGPIEVPRCIIVISY